MSEDTDYGANTLYKINYSCIFIKPYGNCSPSTAPRPMSSPENLLDMQIRSLLPDLLTQKFGVGQSLVYQAFRVILVTSKIWNTQLYSQNSQTWPYWLFMPGEYSVCCPVHWTMFGSIPGQSPLRTSSDHLPQVLTRSISRQREFPRRQNFPM